MLGIGTYESPVVPLTAMEEEPALGRVTITFADAESFEYHYVVHTDRLEPDRIPDLLRRAGRLLLDEAETAGHWLSMSTEHGPVVVGQGSSSGAHLHRRDAPANPSDV
jgi:hypothetical protein